MRFVNGLLLAAAVILAASPVYATVYQYFDQEGTLIVTDNPYKVKKPKPLPAETKQKINLRYREDVAYDYYPVTGKNFQELISSTNLNGPFDAAEGKKYAGQTKWNLGWSYKFSSSYTLEDGYIDVSLNIYDVEFLSDITVLIPQAQDTSNLSHTDMMLWEGFSQRLLDHEHDHVRIVRDPLYRNDATAKISSIKQLTVAYDPRADLDRLIKDAVEAETARIGHDLIMVIKKQNEEYDRITDHGLKPEMRGVFFGR